MMIFLSLFAFPFLYAAAETTAITFMIVQTQTHTQSQVSMASVARICVNVVCIRIGLRMPCAWFVHSSQCFGGYNLHCSCEPVLYARPQICCIYLLACTKMSTSSVLIFQWAQAFHVLVYVSTTKFRFGHSIHMYQNVGHKKISVISRKSSILTRNNFYSHLLLTYSPQSESFILCDYKKRWRRGTLEFFTPENRSRTPLRLGQLHGCFVHLCNLALS